MDKDTLYRAYLKEKKQKQKDEKTVKKYNLSKDENTIIINQNSNNGIKICSLFVDVIIKLLKFIIIVVIVCLVTIGATVILNKELLNYIINYIGW